MLGLAVSVAKGGASLLTYVKDNLKLYLDFKSNRSDTLKFPSEGSTLFDGTNDCIDCGNDSSIQFSGSFSVGAWVRTTDATATNEILVSKANDGVNQGWMLKLNSSRKVQFEIYVGGVILTTDPGDALNDGNWHHIVGVHESGVGNKLYKDGVEVHSNTTGTDLTEHVPNLHIGNQDYSTPRAINADICNVFAYSRVLSAEEVQSVMNKNYSQLGSVEKTSLVMWQSLDSNASSGVHSSGYANSHIAETLGTELVKSDLDETDWTVSGTTQVTENNGVFTVTKGNSPYGAKPQLTGSGILTTNLTAGKLYKTSWTSYITGSGTGTIPFSFHTSPYDHQLPVMTTTAQNYEVYFLGASGSGQIQFNTPANVSTVIVSNLSVKEVTSVGWGVQKFPASTGTSSADELATTTSVYGGNAPVLPRAIDIAESQAEAIGNGSASFNGTSDYIVIPHNNLLNMVSSFTISAWVQVNSTSGVYRRIIGKQTSGTLCNYGLGLQNSDEPTTLFNNGNWIQDYQSPLSQDTWHHIVGVWNDSNNRLMLYKNGIEIGNVDKGSQPLSTNTNDLTIGSHKETGGEHHSGKLAHIGLWNGVLTQAQIQSLMESTSYSKIPEDVKSTLGSELVGDPSFDTGGADNITGLGSSAEVTGGALVFTDPTDGSTGSTNPVFKKGGSNILTSGKIYKFVFTIADAQGSGARLQIVFDANSSTGGSYSDHQNYTDGTHTLYTISNSTSAEFNISGASPSFKMTDVSIKEVTNDIVAYYPLDADSSANGVTQDVTTGEVLGTEVNTLANALSPTNETNATTGLSSLDSNITSVSDVTYSGSYSIKFETDANAEWMSASSNFTVENGKLYKFSITWKTASSSHAMKHLIGTSSGNSSYVNIEGVAGSTDWVTSDYYFITTATTLNFKFAEFTGDSNIIMYIDNISIKKVTSNTGVLK